MQSYVNFVSYSNENILNFGKVENAFKITSVFSPLQAPICVLPRKTVTNIANANHQSSPQI